MVCGGTLVSTVLVTLLIFPAFLTLILGSGLALISGSGLTSDSGSRSVPFLLSFSSVVFHHPRIYLYIFINIHRYPVLQRQLPFSISYKPNIVPIMFNNNTFGLSSRCDVFYLDKSVAGLQIIFVDTPMPRHLCLFAACLYLVGSECGL